MGRAALAKEAIITAAQKVWGALGGPKVTSAARKVGAAATGNWPAYEITAGRVNAFLGHPVGLAVAGAGIGGVTSMLTGGSFTSGAFYGGIGGAAGYGLNLKRDALGKFIKGSPVGANLMAGMFEGATRTRRRAVLGGAALGGAIFGNRANKHTRGMNSTRGAHI